MRTFWEHAESNWPGCACLTQERVKAAKDAKVLKADAQSFSRVVISVEGVLNEAAAKGTLASAQDAVEQTRGVLEGALAHLQKLAEQSTLKAMLLSAQDTRRFGDLWLNYLDDFCIRSGRWFRNGPLTDEAYQAMLAAVAPPPPKTRSYGEVLEELGFTTEAEEEGETENRRPSRNPERRPPRRDQ